MIKHNSSPLMIYLNTLPDHLQQVAGLLVTNMPFSHTPAELLVLLTEPVLCFGRQLTTEEQQALISILAALHCAKDHGSTGLPLSSLEWQLTWLLTDHQTNDNSLLSALLPVCKKMLTAHKPDLFFGTPEQPQGHLLICTDKMIYLARDYFCETELVCYLQQLSLAPVKNDNIDHIINMIVDNPSYSGSNPMVLTTLQRQAVIQSLGQRISILTGGPGSGKTAVIAAILRGAMLKGYKPHELLLAAPTGKAANRIAEAVEKNLRAIATPLPEDEQLQAMMPQPQTLHRLLAYNPQEGFKRDKNNTLAARLLIVDEASMINIYLLRQLLEALGPTTQLLLVGDPNQLPPIGCANILKDLQDQWHGSSRCTILDSSFRMSGADNGGQQIATLAQALITKNCEACTPNTFDSFDELPTSGIQLVTPNNRQSALKTYLRHHFAQKYEPVCQLFKEVYHYTDKGFSQQENMQLQTIFRQLGTSLILGVTNQGDYGVEGLNNLAHYVHLDLTNSSGTLAPGEPVICTRNDYFHNLFNGDIGFMAYVQSGKLEPSLMAVFPREGSFIPLPLESLRDHLALAHTLTVHKSQGSETNELLLVLPDKPSELLTNELLYTAITRARHHVIICGQAELWIQGCKKHLRRESGLRENL